ncbi:hypothetical protein JCM9279_000282 [Rhodotorula babjevae]
MSAHGATGLARLPEELVDLVCSFVVDFKIVQDTVTTLYSLALTSRRFLEPARRALLHDPSRILLLRGHYHAEYLLHLVLRRPELGSQVKRLDGLVDLFDRDEELYDLGKPVSVFTNWAFTLMRSCPNLVSVVIWPDLGDGWLDELVRIPRLRHVGFQARYSGLYWDGYGPRALDFLRMICQRGPLFLESIASSCNFRTLKPHLAVAPRVSSLHLDHSYFGPGRFGDGIDLEHVRHLHLKAHGLSDMLRLPSGLETLILELSPPATKQVDPAVRDDVYWNEPFSEPDALCALRSVRLTGGLACTSALARLAAAAPNLERLELYQSRWIDVDLYRPEQDAALVEVLIRLPRLRFLHLGEVPHHGETIFATRAYCRQVDIELEYRCEPDAHVASPTPPASDLPTPASDLGAAGPTFPSHPALRRTPSPTPAPDDDDLTAALVSLARTAAEVQHYADAPAAPPRLERGFEAHDDGVDEELDEAAPWDGWGSECDMDEADRAWCECDDEGAWECARALCEEEG